MRIGKKIIPVAITSLLIFSTLSIFSVQLFQVGAQIPVANLTGTIYDGGVDTDGDGSFDHLEVGVEINVTDSGDYKVEIWNLLDSGHDYISVSGHKSEYLDAGVQVVNILLYGPTIYVSGLNPVNVSWIALYSVEFVPPFEYMVHWLDSVYDVPLSQEYLYTEFDSPFTDIEAIFVVYPDGRVVMEGTLDYTDMEPPYTEPPMYGVASVEKSGILTLVSANFTLIVPPEEASQFPFNSSAFTLLSEYSGDLLTTTISGNTILPPSIASEFPFNVTDFTVMGEYAGGMVDGNITVYLLPGFPLGDIEMDFHGNSTYVYLSGSSTVIFGYYPDFGELNATVLDDLLQELKSTIPGQGPDSLYNMTDGLFECTRLDTTTTLYDNSATVDFEAEFQGDLIQTFVNMTGQPASMYEVLNATWSSVESGGFVLAYAHALKEADMDFVFTVNMTYLIDNMIPILPDILPTEEAAFIESILNTTYCTVDSAQVLLDYENGQVTLNATATIQDNFNAEINYIKSMFLTYGDVPQPLTSQIQILNETQLDLTNFRMSFNLTETSVEVDVSEFAVLPPLDWIDATSFRLERFFNITANEDEPPGEGEKLKVTVEGGSNATHTVTISRPGTVPEPDISAPDRMIWNNQSISSLKDIIFEIERDSTPPVIGTPVHTPETPEPDEAVTVSVDVTDEFGVRSDRVTLSYSTDDGGTWDNVTMNKATGDTYEGEIPGLPGGTNVQYMIIAYDYAGNFAIDDNNGQYYVYEVIDSTPPVIGTPVHTPETPEPDEAVTVSVDVTDADTGIRSDGVILSYSTDDGGTWDNVTMNKATGDAYEGMIPGLPAGTNVQYMIIAYNNAGNYAIDDNNGQYYVYEVSQVPFWMQWWFWVIVIVGIVALAGAVYFLKKRKPQAPTAPTLPSEGTPQNIHSAYSCYGYL